MTPTEMKTFIDDLYIMCATDIDKAMELYIHEDFVIEEAPELPMHGTYKGREGLKKLYAKVFALCEATGLERGELMCGENCCANKVFIQLADPKQEPIELMEYFRFHEGKIIEIKPYYFSSGQFNRAAGVG